MSRPTFWKGGAATAHFSHHVAIAAAIAVAVAVAFAKSINLSAALPT